MNKSLLMVVVFSLLLPYFVFAGGQAEEADDVVQIDFSSWRTEDVPIYQELISMFEAENPGIRVTYSPYRTEEYQTVLAANFQGNTAADVIHLRAYGNFEQFARPGYLLEITEDIVPELAVYSDQSLAGSTSTTDGKVYGIPYASQSLVIYYNTDLYDELGLDVPRTWDDFLDNLRVLDAEGITPLANGTKTGWMNEVMLGVIGPNFYGGNEFYDRLVAGETDFTDPDYIGAIETLHQLAPFMPSGYTGLEYVDQQMLFINGMAGHFIGGIWEDSYFGSQNPDLNYDIFFGPVENAGDEQFVSAFMDGSFGINRNTEHREEAIRFVRFLASLEAQQYLSDTLGVRTEHPDVVPTQPLLQKVMAPDVNTTPYIMLVSFRYEQPTGSELIQNGLQALFGGEMSAEEVARSVQEGVETYYEPFQD
jgi:raffinose/stachyose/melibiose transport system substrate-binding protein